MNSVCGEGYNSIVDGALCYFWYSFRFFLFFLHLSLCLILLCVSLFVSVVVVWCKGFAYLINMLVELERFYIVITVRSLVSSFLGLSIVVVFRWMYPLLWCI